MIHRACEMKIPFGVRHNHTPAILVLKAVRVVHAPEVRGIDTTVSVKVAVKGLVLTGLPFGQGFGSKPKIETLHDVAGRRGRAGEFGGVIGLLRNLILQARQSQSATSRFCQLRHLRGAASLTPDLVVVSILR